MRLIIVGAGTMGIGIASVGLAKNAIDEVIVCLRDASKIDEVQKTIKKSIQRYLRLNKLDLELEEVMSHLSIHSDLAAVGAADVVIEAIKEDFEAKKELYKKLNTLIGDSTKVLTNTSSLSISALSQSFSDPSLFAGLHFFNPVTHSPVVEAVYHKEVSLDTKEAIDIIVRKMGVEKVETNDSPGFVVNRILIPMINQAATLIDNGVATVEDIDRVMKLAANHPIGPFALADLIGIDVVVAILKSFDKEDSTFNSEISPSLLNLVDLGHLGKKTLKGFYDYSKK